MYSLLPSLAIGLLAVDLGPMPSYPVEPAARAAVGDAMRGLARPTPEARLDAATALAALAKRDAAAVPALIEALFRRRVAHPDELRPMILLTGAQVPNWKSSDPLWITRTPPRWFPTTPGEKRPKPTPPVDPEKVDWLATLNTLALDHPDLSRLDPAARELARLEAFEVVAIMRALAASSDPRATVPLFRFAFEPEGIFRDECGRQIRAIGDASVAELVPLQHRAPLPKMKRYASFQLDRMDRANPKKAVAAMPDDRLRASLLHQYGEVRALDAVEPVLDYVDADSLRVRREARYAWMRYVAGKAPPPAPKRHRKLPGGREETEEKPDYLTYRELAELALQKRLAADLPDLATATKLTAEEKTQKLFALYDGRRAEKWQAIYDNALAAWQRGEVEALKSMTEILAHEPAFSHRAAIGAILVEHADRQRKDGKLAEAVSLYRQGLALLPEGDRSRWEARLLLAEGQLGEKSGKRDAWLYEQALMLDPKLDEARAAKARLATVRADHASSATLILAVVVGVAMLIAGAMLRRRGKPSAASSSKAT